MDSSFANDVSVRKPGWRERLLTVVLSGIRFGTLHVRFPSGAGVSFAGQQQQMPTASICFHSWSAINRIMTGGANGVGEGYMAGEWETPDLTRLLCMLANNRTVFERKLPFLKGIRFFEKYCHRLNRNTRSGSRRNIACHYDLGNDFYRLWLDETMSYSAALFADANMSLADAQRGKYARLAKQLAIRPGDKILEIGCGWGGFAEYAVTRLGCKVDCITLSQEQLVFAENRLGRLAQGANASFSRTDYRDVKGTYDKIVSIEMLEAVGEAYWYEYFRQIAVLLKPGGRAGIQVITIDDERFQTYRTGADFIQKYIFPGGMLLSDTLFRQHTKAAGLSLCDNFDFGADYAQTLVHWRNLFMARKQDILKLGFDDRFIRMWLFYFSYCETGFLQKTISVKQYVVEKQKIC